MSERINQFTKLAAVAALWVISVVAVARLIGKIPQSSIEPKTQAQIQKVVEEESAVIDVVEKVSPSVVSIAVESRQLLLDPFFGIPRQGQRQQSGIGTGFVVRSDGLIVTNKHVVSQEAEKYIAIIRSNDGGEKKYEVKKIHRDPFNDLALLQVDPSTSSGQVLKAVELGDSEHLKVGQSVVAIGNALGQFANTVTVGIVSGLGRGVVPIDPLTGVAERLDDLIQTDAAINPGNSGGPLVNIAGQVIGINTAVASAENIGFAIKVNIAKQLIEDFSSSGGKIVRPFLGIRYSHISRETALLNEVPEGELVREVVGGSAADKAGIEVGDIITQFDGQKLTDETSLSKLIREKKVGDVVKVRVFRGGQTLDLTVTLGEATGE
ncbi:trypsin-like peptidase domain-containing protein [Candidatus Curtissbacteria bacterium]|nr:trypsin-like peptidase domain-containing protein [Candidatus Curtissbacteria bacterium]